MVHLSVQQWSRTHLIEHLWRVLKMTFTDTSHLLWWRWRKSFRKNAINCLNVETYPRRHKHIKAQVVQILTKFVTDMETMKEATDIVPRTGKKLDNKNRQVIILFTLRYMKEEIWRQSKGSTVCKDKSICLAEIMQPHEDLEEKRRLWLQIQKRKKCLLSGALWIYWGASDWSWQVELDDMTVKR